MSNPACFPAQLIGNLGQSETMEIAKIKQMVESYYRYMQTQGYENILSAVFYRFCADSLEMHEF